MERRTGMNDFLLFINTEAMQCVKWSNLDLSYTLQQREECKRCATKQTSTNTVAQIAKREVKDCS
jgi:hypothetical protein